MTEDGRYSLSTATRQMLDGLDDEVEVRLLLSGNLNASFLKLRNAGTELLDEMGQYADVSYHTLAPQSGERGIAGNLTPTVIHEKQRDGQTAQTTIYPYAIVRYKGKEALVPLLRNTRGLSGEENVNQSIEQLEFAFAEAINSLTKKDVKKVAFIEGHGELAEPYVYDLSLNLSKYFQIDRGQLTGNAEDIFGYDAIVIADPQAPFSEADKYQIDRYVMQGGKVLWVMDGVRFSDEILSKDGYTPVIALDLNLQDLLFRYGIRISPCLLQDRQCLPVPVDVSEDPANPNFQPMPWYYAPLLLTSQQSPVTRSLGQVSSTFCSAVEFVGEDDGLYKNVLLATSSSTRVTGVPAEVDLSLIELDPEQFRYSYVPVAAAVEGEFPSLFAHRMAPDGVVEIESPKQSVKTRQVIVASGSIIRNELQQGQPLPLGYDRYTGMQFANKDFLTNALLYLTDDEGLITLRNKTITLRLLNDQRSHDGRKSVQLLTIGVPLLLLLIVGILFTLLRKHRYSKSTIA